MGRHISLAVVAVAVLVTASGLHAAWDPPAWKGESTIQLRTTAPGEAAHWFPVWLVVLDGQAYVRLGTRAAGRFAANTTAPYLGVRVAGQEFDRVKAEPAPDEAGRVAEAMKAKYWSDFLARQFSHPLTVRLVPDTASAGR